MSMEPYYQSDRATLYLGDCLEVLAELPAGTVDAVVTDPPYGMRWNTDSTRFSGGKHGEKRYRDQGRDDWGAVRQDDHPFDPTPWLEYPKVVLWGANHYAAHLPVGTTLVWLKKGDHLFGTFLSDAEIGWMKGGYGVYCHRRTFAPPTRRKENAGETAHPTQKPIGLMAWCMDRLKLPPDALVLDPFAGSGTTGVAALQTGRWFIGVEIDERYAEIAAKRLERAETEARQSSLFEAAQ